MSVVINGTDGITFNDGSLQPSAIGKNLIINGNMQIAQRGTSVSGITGTQGYYTLDRFAFRSTYGAINVSQSTDVPSGQGFYYSNKIQCNTLATPIGAEEVFTDQKIEAQNLQHLKFGTSSAETITLSFWVKSNKTGNYGVWLWIPDSSRGNSVLYTINNADTWEKKTITINGDTVGTIDNDNGQGLYVRFYFGTGDTNKGTITGNWIDGPGTRYPSDGVNLLDSTANYINITGVQLEVGTTATPFENLMYSQQLAMCQRYYYKISGTNFPYGAGFTNSSTAIRWHATFPVQMRTPPTSLETTGTASDYRILQAVAVTATSVPNFQSASETTFRGGANCSTASFSLNNGAILDSGGTAYLAWSAEL